MLVWFPWVCCLVFYDLFVFVFVLVLTVFGCVY